MKNTFDTNKDTFLEWGAVSLRKYGEELAGDKVEVVYHDDEITLVLSDGLGSGVKANILATLTSKMLATMLANGIPIIDCVEAILETLPVCKVRNVAYSTFSIIHLNQDGEGMLFEFDAPQAILLRDGKSLDCPYEEMMVQGRLVTKTHLKLQDGDAIINMSDGVMHAGIGTVLNFGWGHKQIVSYMEEHHDGNLSARALAALLGKAAKDLYLDKMGDDTTIACVKFRKKQVVNILVGPPVQKEQDETVCENFLGKEGIHIVCGGTSSTIIARHLGEDIETSLDFPDRDIPPIGFIKGIDLTTEGVVTLRRLLELAKEYLELGNVDDKHTKKRDGASLLSNMLFENATHVNFHVGRSVNIAHTGEIGHTMKLMIIDKLAAELETMGKTVTIEYH
ncbi:MAG: SpoIIE family protein phosphatase [Bacillota bacterium]